MGLFLADLSEKSEQEIKEHVAKEYGSVSSVDYGTPDATIQKELATCKVLVAYESVGSWGCDSSSYFLFKRRNGTMFEVLGSHCSCDGFEGQWSPQEATVEYLKSDKFYLGTGGYDDNSDENQRAVKEFFATLGEPDSEAELLVKLEEAKEALAEKKKLVALIQKQLKKKAPKLA
jgi:hypothetical protein